MSDKKIQDKRTCGSSNGAESAFRTFFDLKNAAAALEITAEKK